MRCPQCLCEELRRSRRRPRLPWYLVWLHPFTVTVVCDLCGARFHRCKLFARHLPYHSKTNRCDQPHHISDPKPLANADNSDSSQV
jgi:hypothetical protein